MYYKEEIIDGILCNKVTPSGAWTPVGEKALKKRVEELKAKVARLQLELAAK